MNYLIYFIVSCLCISIELTTVVLSGWFEMCRLYGGYYFSPLQLNTDPGWRFADALSYLKYVFVGKIRFIYMNNYNLCMLRIFYSRSTYLYFIIHYIILI